MTARLLARRWPLYLLTCAAVFALQAALYVLVPDKRLAFECAGLLGSPLIVVVVTVFAGGDAASAMTAAQRWERIFERGWAIVVFDVGLSFAQLSGIDTMAGGGSRPSDILMGFLTLLLTGMLVYAEPFIALEKDAAPLTLLPFAILRSMTLAWVNLSRVFSLLALNIAAGIGDVLVSQLVARAGANAVAWTDLAYGTLVTVPLAALYAVAYLDTLVQERRTP